MAVGLGAAAPASAQVEPGRSETSSQSIDLSWRNVDLPRGGRGLRVEDIIASEAGFLAVGGGVRVSPTKIARVWSSRNGRRWRSVPLSGRARRGVIRAVVQTPDGFVAVGQGPCIIACSAVWRSSDGLAWRRLPILPVLADSVMRDVVLFEGRLIAVGCRNEGFHCADGRVWASDDGGRTWRQLVDVPSLNFNAAAVVDGQLVGAGDTHGIDEIGQPTYGTSLDGVDWTVHVPEEDVGLGRMLAAGGRGDIALVSGGGRDPSGSFSSAILNANDGEGALLPIESRVFARGRFVALATHDDLVLLAGARESARGYVPYAVWTSDLTAFQRVRFPRDSERPFTIIYAVAFSRNGARVVAGGDANNRTVMWFSRVLTQ